MIICSPQLGLAPNSILGGEVFDREILLGLAKSGVKISIILPKGKPHDKNVKNWYLIYLPITHFPAFFANILFVPYLFYVYYKTEFEILRIHSPHFLGFACTFFKLFHKNIKLVITYHQYRESKFGPFSKFVNNLWDHIVCDSQYVKNKLIKTYQIKSSIIIVVHNGVPTYLRPARKDPEVIKKLDLDRKVVLLFMGIFNKRKNPLFLLDILAHLNREDIVLIFWGEGPLRSKIIQKAKKLGVEDKIRIIDPIFGPEKNKIHNLADIFVHPSIDEGFALAPLEAMACAKPVVITHGYSAQEVVGNGVNGFLCHSNDLDQWSNKISELIDDPKLRIRMGNSSLMKVKKEFQWQLAVDAHYRLLKNLII